MTNPARTNCTGAEKPLCPPRGDATDACPFFFFKQETAYELSECDWSSDVCSSDLHRLAEAAADAEAVLHDAVEPVLGGRWRSEERRVGKECRIGCRSRGSPYH